jgi:hypothetical protein
MPEFPSDIEVAAIRYRLTAAEAVKWVVPGVDRLALRIAAFARLHSHRGCVTPAEVLCAQ